MKKETKSLSVCSKSRSFHYSAVCKLILILFFAFFVIMPLIRMLFYINADSIGRVISGSLFVPAVLNSIKVALISTVIALILAYALAVCVERSGIKFAGFWNIILILPMLIPSISHGMGLIVLLGNNGIITRLFGLSWNIYGMWGIVIGSVMYAFPVAFLMIRDVLKYEDRSPYEAAEILGIPKWRQFTAITVPYLRKPLISVIFAVFTMVVTDYGVPLIVGGKFSTIPVVMYQEVIGQLDFGKGAVYGVILLIPAIIAFVFDLLNKDRGNSSFVRREFESGRGRLKRIFAYIFCGAVSVCVLLPIVAFVILGFAENYPGNLTFTLENISRTFNLGAGRYLLNSVIIAVLVSVIGVVISFVTAYFTARVKSGASRFLHLIAITSAAIPGIVLGLSYVIVFKGSFIYGTIAILIMVNIIHFIASPYIMMYNSLGKINCNLEAVGETLGVGRLRMVKDVFIPQCSLTICEMFSYFFVNCMMTISAVSFLATTSNKPAALMINQFEAQTQLECAAVISLLILMINILLKFVLYIIKKLMSKTRIANSAAADTVKSVPEEKAVSLSR